MNSSGFKLLGENYVQFFPTWRILKRLIWPSSSVGKKFLQRILVQEILVKSDVHLSMIILAMHACDVQIAHYRYTLLIWTVIIIHHLLFNFHAW